MHLVMPAVIPTSFHDLEEKLTLFDQIPTTRVQIDMIDGLFAFPPSWPYNSGTELRDRVQRGEMLPRLDRVKYEADLLCNAPEKIASHLLDLGVVRLTIHAESTDDVTGLLARLRSQVGAEANFVAALISIGLSINMETDVDVLIKHANQVEYMQLMGIDEIGKQGQPLNPRVIEKIKAVRKACPEAYIQIDGGVTLENAKSLVDAGVSRLAIGSALLNAPNIVSAAGSFEALRGSYGVLDVR